MRDLIEQFAQGKPAFPPQGGVQPLEIVEQATMLIVDGIDPERETLGPGE